MPESLSETAGARELSGGAAFSPWEATLEQYMGVVLLIRKSDDHEDHTEFSRRA
jgi:hypothetical protein